MSILERSPQDNVPPYTLSINIKYPNGVSTDIVALVDTGSPVSLLKSTVVPFVSGSVPPKSDLAGINGSKLDIVDQFSADVSHAELDVPISLNFHVVPNNTIKSDCLLGRNFLSHPRVILSVSDGEFLISFKQTLDIPFDEILSLDYDNNDKRELLDLDLDIETK